MICFCETFPPGYINRSGTNMPFAKPMVPGRWSRAVRAMVLREIYFLFLYSVGGFSAGMAAVLFILFLHRMAG